jgi:hypothetical protein
MNTAEYFSYWTYGTGIHVCAARNLRVATCSLIYQGIQNLRVIYQSPPTQAYPLEMRGQRRARPQGTTHFPKCRIPRDDVDDTNEKKIAVS